ncbi:hypothetical protein QBC42DRAFT_196199 [Cladorrhinum samala]|uniref:Uncharacterized protein n=1 Tax=Cladorrhinum samala TaxID=585594 RepID=A0AAV9HW63_9PEZI|nr:hypothetical protein QBC42DRAFT_196199 [Cladorrhinum samala]
MASEGTDQPQPKPYSTDPALFIYTSLTAGSSHIVTATSRLETILRANRVPFKAIDIAVDEKARMLWGRRAGKDASGRQRKLPGLVQEGFVLGDLVEIEEWNEYGELKQHVKIYYDEFTIPSINQAPPPVHPKPADPIPLMAPKAEQPKPSTASTSSSTTKNPSSSSSTATTAPAAGATITLPIRSIAEEAAQKAKQASLQALRDKVHGSKSSSSSEPNKKDEKKENAAPAPSVHTAAATATTTTKTTTTTGETPAGLQSPTSTGWKSAAVKDAASLTGAVQSPTTSSWKPTDVDPPVKELHGSLIAEAAKEVIEAIERAETIKEEEEEDDSEDEKDKAAGKK